MLILVVAVAVIIMVITCIQLTRDSSVWWLTLGIIAASLVVGFVFSILSCSNEVGIYVFFLLSVFLVLLPFSSKDTRLYKYNVE